MTLADLQRHAWLPLGAVLASIAIASTGIHWAVTLLALAVVAFCAFLQPAMVAAVVVLSIPVQSEILLPFVRGELTVTQLTVFGLVAGWGIVFWRRRLWLDSVVVGFLLILAAYVLSFIAVDTPSLWFQETYRWAIAGVFYVICRSVIGSWRDVRLLLWAMALGAAGVSLLAVAQLLEGAGPADFLSGGVVRVYGSFGTPNTLAAYLELTVPLLLAAIAAVIWGDDPTRLGTIERWVFAVASALGLLAIGLTQSRGGWLGIALACLVLWIPMPGRIRVLAASAAVVMVGAFILTPPGREQLDRFLEVRDQTTQTDDITLSNRSSYDTGSGRGAIWGAARAMIADNPVIGVGAGEFDEHYREYVPSWIDRYPRGQAHNVWLQMGAQAGILGIVAYAAWFAASVWSIVTARRRATSTFRRWLITGVLAVFAAYTVHSLVDYLNVLSLGLQLSAITAIALNLVPEPLSRYHSARSASPTIPYAEHATCRP